MSREEGRRERQDGRREGEGQSVNVVTLERFSDYSKWILVMTSGAIFFFHATSIDFLVCLGLLGFTFLADFALELLIFFSKRPFNEHLYTIAKILIYFIDLLMMLTSASLLLLLNLSYAMVIILVLPLMMIVIIVCYNGMNTDQARELTDYGTLQPALKQFFDLSASVTAANFTAMITTIFSYFKNSQKDDDRVDFKFPEIFIFFTVNFGLLMMLLTTAPPSLRHPNARLRYITFIKFLSYSLLQLTALTVAAVFLGYLNYLAFLPIFLATAVWFKQEFIQEDGTI